MLGLSTHLLVTVLQILFFLTHTGSFSSIHSIVLLAFFLSFLAATFADAIPVILTEGNSLLSGSISLVSLSIFLETTGCLAKIAILPSISFDDNCGFFF